MKSPYPWEERATPTDLTPPPPGPTSTDDAIRQTWSWPAVPHDFLTAEEHDCVTHLTRAANLLFRITRGADPEYPHDWEEAAAAIHVLQRMVLSQAAGRAYPDRYRLLGNPQPRGPAEEPAPPEVASDYTQALIDRARAMHEDDPSKTVGGWLDYLRELLTEQHVSPYEYPPPDPGDRGEPGAAGHRTRPDPRDRWP